MMRWFLWSVSLFLVILLLIGSPPIRAATSVSPASSDCDEHPWDFLKNAYKVEIIVVTTDYILLAVWYTKDQAQPVIIRVDLQVPSASGNEKKVTKGSFIFIE